MNIFSYWRHWGTTIDWYVTGQMITVALCDSGLCDEEREQLAKAIQSQPNHEEKSSQENQSSLTWCGQMPDHPWHILSQKIPGSSLICLSWAESLCLYHASSGQTLESTKSWRNSVSTSQPSMTPQSEAATWSRSTWTRFTVKRPGRTSSNVSSSEGQSCQTSVRSFISSIKLTCVISLMFLLHLMIYLPNEFNYISYYVSNHVSIIC